MVLLLLLSTYFSSAAQKQLEYLDRGVVAIRTSHQEVFISWRMLGTDPQDVAFNVYRGGLLLNDTPITDSTNFTDSTAFNYSYTVLPVMDGVEQSAFGTALPWVQPYWTLPLQRPNGGITPDGQDYEYQPNDCSVGDLDGDGDYEIIVKWDPTNSKDNAYSGYTGNVFIDAYNLQGARLWRIDLGRNIRAGAHYTQFMVYDLDGDGKAELACRTADGTIDGVGTIIGDGEADHRKSDGYILEGPEFLTIFNGETGQAMVTTDYIPARGAVSSWGDNYGNRVDRFLAGIAYLDGERPSLLMCRGYYTRTVIAAWDWRAGELTQRWIFDTDGGPYADYEGQGAHSLTIGDVDGDGKDEITYGACAIDDDGTGLYNTGLGHGDALHLSDMDPDRPGMEVFMVHESPSQYGPHGVEMRDAASGEILWSRPGNGADIGRGVAMDIDPNYKGYEAWGTRGGLNSATGEQISDARPPLNFGVWWDGDWIRELLDKTLVSKWDFIHQETQTILSADIFGGVANNGTKATPALSADILGDWREEVIWRHRDNDKLLIFSTTIPTEHRLPTLMHDAQYRTAIAWQNVGYNQPPHPSFYLGDSMEIPPLPDIQLVSEQAPPALINLGLDNIEGGPYLHWVASGTAGDLEIYRDTAADPANGQLLAVLTPNSTTFQDENVDTSQTDYSYWVKSTDTNGDTIFSNVVNTAFSRTSIALEAQAGNTVIELQWEITGTSDTIIIYRDTDADPAGRLRIASLTQMEQSYSDNNLINGVTYYYWIETNDFAGEKVSSNLASATPVNITLFQENETGFCGVDGTVDAEHEGFTGTGFANTDNAVGEGIDYRIEVGEAKGYTMRIRYANGANSNRPIRVLLNGNEVGTLDAPPTGEWFNWAETALEVLLPSGVSELRLEATTSGGLPNIDYLSIVGETVNTISCDSTVTNTTELGIGQNDIRIFPNPSSDVFQIEAINPTLQYRIYAATGSLLEQGTLGKVKSFGQTLPPGIYWLILTHQSMVANHLLIKQ